MDIVKPGGTPATVGLIGPGGELARASQGVSLWPGAPGTDPGDRSRSGSASIGHRQTSKKRERSTRSSTTVLVVSARRGNTLLRTAPPAHATAPRARATAGTASPRPAGDCPVVDCHVATAAQVVQLRGGGPAPRVLLRICLPRPRGPCHPAAGSCCGRRAPAPRLAVAEQRECRWRPTPAEAPHLVAARETADHEYLAIGEQRCRPAAEAGPHDLSDSRPGSAAGSYTSGETKVLLPPWELTPATIGVPSDRGVAPCPTRMRTMFPVTLHFPVLGSYSSAVGVPKSRPVSGLPATSTLPIGQQRCRGQLATLR